MLHTFLILLNLEALWGNFLVVLTQGRRVCIFAHWAVAGTFMIYLLVHNGIDGSGIILYR